MNEQILNKLNNDNAETICERIRHEAEEEIKKIHAAASREKEKILAEAQKKAQEERQRLISESEKEVLKEREKIFSALALEKKRLILQNKDRFVKAVFEHIHKEATEFRQHNDYPEFLKKAVAEGIEIIGLLDVEVCYSCQDAGLLNDGFKKKVEAYCSEVGKGTVSIRWKQGDFRDIGVIVYSRDGRLMYDNRFSARLERAKQKIEQELLRIAP